MSNLSYQEWTYIRMAADGKSKITYQIYGNELDGYSAYAYNDAFVLGRIAVRTPKQKHIAHYKNFHDLVKRIMNGSQLWLCVEGMLIGEYTKTTDF